MAFINNKERTELAEKVKSDTAAIFFFHLLRKGMFADNISGILYSCFQKAAVDLFESFNF